MQQPPNRQAVQPSRHRGARFAERRARLLKLVADEGLGGLIVTHLPNVRYLTGFTGTAGVVLLVPQETVFLSDFRYRTQAEAELGRDVRVEIPSSDVWERLWRVLGEYPAAERVGFEAQKVTVAEAERFTRTNGRTRFQPVKDLVERLRVSKDRDEVAAIRAAGRLASEALAATLPCVQVGQRELDVAARLEGELRARGSEWHPFPTIVASGPRSALPHAGTSERVIERGDWLLLDFGAQVDGYCADVTRCVVVGRAADERQRLLLLARNPPVPVVDAELRHVGPSPRWPRVAIGAPPRTLQIAGKRRGFIWGDVRGCGERTVGGRVRAQKSPRRAPGSDPRQLQTI